MSHHTPFERDCDCRCTVHNGYRRTTYNDEGCACTLTCATAPMTLLAEQWGCALFLDLSGDLWFVNRLPGGQWDWTNAGHVHEHHDSYDASVLIEQLLRQIALTLRASIHP